MRKPRRQPWRACKRRAVSPVLCERAGVLNLGIEGIMVAGAFTGWLAVYHGLGLWSGVAVASRFAVQTSRDTASNVTIDGGGDVRRQNV